MAMKSPPCSHRGQSQPSQQHRIIRGSISQYVVSYPQNPYRIRTLLPCSSTIAIDLFMCLIVWKKYKDDSSRTSRRSHNTTVAIIP
ncbi:hypothetical protein M422DRAFT_25850 [Sphaerobolus stellatus SS14]|nr:hypothetical protein M422DRAFT_25850 [Sphaerobolus stellatus SS14]